MKYLMVLLALSALTWISCTTDNINIVETDRHQIDSSYIDPFRYDFSPILISYIDLDRIDTLSAVAMYCQDYDASTYQFFISRRRSYRPNLNLEDYMEDSTFFSISWEQDMLLDTGIVEASFYGNLYINADTQPITSLNIFIPLNFSSTPTDEENIHALGEVDFEAINLNTSNSIGNIKIEFEFNDLTKVICN